jgi:hypothetical protein
MFAKPKSKHDRQFTEASSANLTVEAEGDAFRLGKRRMQILNRKPHDGDAANTDRTKATLQIKPHEGDIAK